MSNNPTLQLNCLATTTDATVIKNLFHVEVNRNAYGRDLREAVQREEYFHDRDDFLLFDISDLSIMANDAPNSVEQRIKNINFENQRVLLYSRALKLTSVDENLLHIVIQIPSNDEGRRDIPALHRRYQMTLHNVLRRRAIVINDGSNGNVAPPVQLFHPIFGHFLDDINSELDVPDNFLREFTTFAKKALKGHNHLESLASTLGFPMGVGDPYDIVKTEENGTGSAMLMSRSWLENVQHLTNFFFIEPNTFYSTGGTLEPVNFFYALSRSLHKLSDYYRSLKPGRIPTIGSRYFPCITAYRENEQTVRFEYVGYLKNDMACVTLHARTCDEPSRNIVVKFVERYGDEAHRVLQDAGLAPQLLYYGTPHCEDGQPSYRNSFMVVMEYIDGKTLFEVRDTVNKDMIKTEVSRALRILHGSGMVFGDLRATNVMISKTDQVKLVDFDWAGTQGQARYPYLKLSKDDFPEAYGTIEMSHDLEKLDRLL